MLTSLLSFGKNFNVGKLAILTSSTSLAVESIFAITTSSLSLNFSPNSSQIGANCLQCPHQGASKMNKEYLINNFLYKFILSKKTLSYFTSFIVSKRRKQKFKCEKETLTKFNEHIFGFILCYFLKVFTDEYFNWFGIPVCWYFFSHKVGLKKQSSNT